MSGRRLMWIGYSGQVTDSARSALEAELDDLLVVVAENGRQALSIVAQDPGLYLIAAIDLQAAEMDLGELVTAIKQINPATEIVVLGRSDVNWRNLSLPRYYRPVLLDPSCSHDVLISCVAKLKEMVDSKEDYAQLGRRLGTSLGMSRSSTEAILGLLDRQNSVGMISMRRDGFFSSYNAEAQRLTGYSPEEVAHVKVWSEVLLPDHDSIRVFLAAIDQFWAHKSGRENMRLRIKRKDDRFVTLSMTVLVLLDNFGQARQIVALFFDPYEICSAREYDVLMDSAPCSLYSYLPEKGFLRISSFALDLMNRAFSTNLSADDVVHHKVTDLPLKSEMADSWQAFLEAVANNTIPSGKGDFPVGLPGRRIMDHVFTARVEAGSDGRFAVLALVAPREDLRSEAFRDYSTQMLAEQTLNTLPHPFVLLRCVRGRGGRIKDFVCIAINPAATAILGTITGCGYAIPLSDVFSDEAAREIILGLSTTLTETGGFKEFEIRLRLREEDDHKSLAEFWLYKVGDGVAVFFRDVTELREEERQLRHYRQVFSFMEEAIIVTDPEGNITDWNPAGERMFGYAKEEILGKPALVLTQNKKGDQLEQDHRKILREGEVWKSEYDFVRGDGSRGVAFSVVALLKDDHGEVYGTVGICHDLTERKRLEERLTAKSKELQEKNLALNTLLRHAEAERLRTAEEIAADLTRRVTERVYRILEGQHKPEVVEIQAHALLQDLGGGEKTREPDREDPCLKLSEKELEVARLIRLGKTTEEIAFILDKSPDTIRLQRISIRKKLGLDRRDRNLTGFLKKMDLG